MGKFNFKQSAQQSTTLSEVMAGRDKLSMDDVMMKYPGGVTLTEFDMVTTPNPTTGEDSTYPVFAIKEDPHVYFFGGLMLTRTCTNWINGYDGDKELCRKEFKESGGVQVKFKRTKTSKGNTLIEPVFMD